MGCRQMIKTAILFLKGKAHIIAVLAIVVAVVAYSVVVYNAGSKSGKQTVQTAWDTQKLADANAMQKAVAEEAEKARVASAAHQQDMAKLRETITQYERLVQYEINKNYSSCVFTPELVSLWRKTFARGAGNHQP